MQLAIKWLVACVRPRCLVDEHASLRLRSGMHTCATSYDGHVLAHAKGYITCRVYASFGT
eukprot:1956759-Pleurochrysis_carterae.AAC.5